MKFESLIGCEIESFFYHHWEKSLVFSRSELDLRQIPCDLPDWDHDLIEKIIFEGDVIMVKDSQYVKRDFLIDKGQVDLKKVLFLWDEGFTFYARRIEDFFPQLKDLTKDLEQELDPIQVQANLFLTPSNQVGLHPHFDCHDIIVMQLDGRKHWRFWPAVKQDMDYESPTTEDQGLVNRAIRNCTPDLEYTMQPGDTFYMPRGVIHAPQSIELSSHLTFWLKSPLLNEINTSSEKAYKKEFHEYRYF